MFEVVFLSANRPNGNFSVIVSTVAPCTAVAQGLLKSLKAQISEERAMTQRQEIYFKQKTSFDDPRQFEIPLDDNWTTSTNAEKCHPEFEDHRSHEKKRRFLQRRWPKAVLWVGCSIGLIVAGTWALTSI